MVLEAALGSKHLNQTEKALIGLRSMIMAGRFKTGQRLPEIAVSEQLGISRTPLRQAMDRLVAEGLLDRISTGGCRVARFTKEDIADAIQIRGVIEGTAARMAAERGADPDLLAHAKSILSQIDTALSESGGIDFDAYVSANRAFHDIIAHLSGSALMIRELERMAQLPLASPSAFLSDQELIPDFQESLKHAQRQHRTILEAIENREGSRAEALAREHARLALMNFNYLTEQKPARARNVPGLALLTEK